MQQRKAKPKPFQNSLSALAQMAVLVNRRRRVRPVPEEFGWPMIRFDSGGADIGEAPIASGRSGVVAYTLGADGVLAFLFQEGQDRRQVRPELDRIAASIEAVGLQRKRLDDIRNSQARWPIWKRG